MTRKKAPKVALPQLPLDPVTEAVTGAVTEPEAAAPISIPLPDPVGAWNSTKTAIIHHPEVVTFPWQGPEGLWCAQTQEFAYTHPATGMSLNLRLVKFGSTEAEARQAAEEQLAYFMDDRGHTITELGEHSAEYKQHLADSGKA